MDLDHTSPIPRALLYLWPTRVYSGGTLERGPGPARGGGGASKAVPSSPWILFCWSPLPPPVHRATVPAAAFNWILA